MHCSDTYIDVSRFVSRSTTALGLSLFSYGGKLNLTLIADEAIIKDERCLMKLLESTVYEINTAYNSFISMGFLKSSDLSIETSAEKGMQIEFLMIPTFNFYILFIRAHNNKYSIIII